VDEQLLGWVNLGPAGSPSRKRGVEDGPVDLSRLVTSLTDEDRPFRPGSRSATG